MQLAFVIGTPGASLRRRLVEASDPAVLRTLVQATLVELNTIAPAVFLASVSLSGAGDGDKWVVEIVAAPSANLVTLDGTTPPGAPTLALIDPGNLTAICYKAADVGELALQRTRALGIAIVTSVTLETMSGAAQGLQHMGLILATLAIQ